MRIIGVDHTGPEPVLVIDFGDREERRPMDQVRAAAVGAPSWFARMDQQDHARRGSHPRGDTVGGYVTVHHPQR